MRFVYTNQLLTLSYRAHLRQGFFKLFVRVLTPFSGVLV